MLVFPDAAIAEKFASQSSLASKLTERIRISVGDLEDSVDQMPAEGKEFFLRELKPLLAYLNYSSINHDQLWLELLERRRVRRELDLIMFRFGVYDTGMTERYIQIRDRLENIVKEIVGEMSKLVAAGSHIVPATPQQITAIHNKHVSQRNWRVATSRIVGEFEDNFTSAFLPVNERKLYLSELHPLLDYLKSTPANEDRFWINLMQRRLARMKHRYEANYPKSASSGKAHIFSYRQKATLVEINNLKLEIDRKIETVKEAGK